MSAQRIELLASASQTASAQGAWMPINTLTMASVFLDITVIDASDLTVWLEGSDDEVTAFELPADQILKTSGAAAPNTTGTNDRDICDGETTVSKHMANYKHLAAKYVRLAWSLTGTSATFDAALVGK